jgi:hypothetical protein
MYVVVAKKELPYIAILRAISDYAVVRWNNGLGGIFSGKASTRPCLARVKYERRYLI